MEGPLLSAQELVECSQHQEEHLLGVAVSAGAGLGQLEEKTQLREIGDAAIATGSSYECVKRTDKRLDRQAVKQGRVCNDPQERRGDGQPFLDGVYIDAKRVQYDLEPSVSFLDKVPCKQLLNLAVLTIQDDEGIMPDPFVGPLERLGPEKASPGVVLVLNKALFVRNSWDVMREVAVISERTASSLEVKAGATATAPVFVSSWTWTTSSGATPARTAPASATPGIVWIAGHRSKAYIVSVFKFR